MLDIKALPDRFWKKVDCSGGPDACWPWLAAAVQGYPIFVNPVDRLVRRYLWFLIELLKDPCVYCYARAVEADHIKPFSKGGSHAWLNRAPTCFDCNRKKNNLGILQFLIKRQLEAVA